MKIGNIQSGQKGGMGRSNEVNGPGNVRNLNVTEYNMVTLLDPTRLMSLIARCARVDAINSMKLITVKQHTNSSELRRSSKTDGSSSSGFETSSLSSSWTENSIANGEASPATRGSSHKARSV